MLLTNNDNDDDDDNNNTWMIFSCSRIRQSHIREFTRVIQVKVVCDLPRSRAFGGHFSAFFRRVRTQAKHYKTKTFRRWSHRPAEPRMAATVAFESRLCTSVTVALRTMVSLQRDVSNALYNGPSSTEDYTVPAWLRGCRWPSSMFYLVFDGRWWANREISARVLENTHWEPEWHSFYFSCVLFDK